MVPDFPTPLKLFDICFSLQFCFVGFFVFVCFWNWPGFRKAGDIFWTPRYINFFPHPMKPKLSPNAWWPQCLWGWPLILYCYVLLSSFLDHLIVARFGVDIIHTTIYWVYCLFFLFFVLKNKKSKKGMTSVSIPY